MLYRCDGYTPRENRCQKYFDDQLPELNDKTIVNSLGWKGARPLNRNDAITYSLGVIDPEQFTLTKVLAIGETLFEAKSALRLIGADGTILEIKGVEGCDRFAQYNLRGVQTALAQRNSQRYRITIEYKYS